jgi:hypothetical protein
MTLSMLMYGLMLCSLAALIALLLADAVRGRLRRPLNVVAPCVPGRTRHASPLTLRHRGASGLRRR